MPILADLACLGSKNDVFVVRNSSQKDNFHRPIPMGYSKSYFKFYVKPSLGTLLWDQFLNVCISLRVPEYQVIILETGPTLHTLEHTFFGKLPFCTSKYYDSWADASMRKGMTRGLLQMFWWEICLRLWFFVPIFQKKSIWGAN